MSQSPMTKLWYITLKPPTNTSSPPFRQLWTEVLDFVSAASGPESSGHHLWQDLAFPDVLVMVSGYPSLSSNLAADKAYVENGYLKRMAEFVDHGRLLQIEIDVNALPVDAEVACIETCWSEDEGQDLIEGVEIGKGGAREKVWVRFSGLKSEHVKQAEREKVEGFQTVYLSKIMGKSI